MKRLTWKHWIVLALAAIVMALGAATLWWAGSTLGPSEAALAALESDATVSVREEAGWLILEPSPEAASTGFIFYPGGGVDYRSYAPVLRPIAARGYRVVLVPMPLNLAFFNANAAEAVIATYPEIDHWAIGGHSLGGVAAAGYAAGHTDVAGLVLWAAYPPDESLKSGSLPVVSIFGSLDGLATPAEIEASRPLLPASTRFVEIEGGNHAQFGSYGPQRGDTVAAITPDARWTQIAEATAALLDSLSD